jgi:hypothetical protein
MYQLNFSQHGLEQLKVPASSDIRQTEANYRFLARIAGPLQKLHEEIQRLEDEKEAAR